MIKRIVDDLDALLVTLPPRVAQPLLHDGDRDELVEVVMDLGRPPEARFLSREAVLSPQEVTLEDLDYVVSRAGHFTSDNRAGIERTLHRISAMRNRQGRVVGLTLRVGRAVFGTLRIIEDLLGSSKNILLLGRPGVGKTTMLREIARVLADEKRKRVVVVDTSNEIAGDGDISHPAIGRARRMQVPTPSLQHAVMIEAVENHMPEVIVIDEIGTELEAAAARTIAERGVQLIATAHGNDLENLVLNPTLCDLVGGIQAVTLGDEEARRRGTQKTVLERKAPPTFDIVVEIEGWDKVAIHADVAKVVDAVLQGWLVSPEARSLDSAGHLHRVQRPPATSHPWPASVKALRLFPFGINQGRLQQAIRERQAPVSLVTDLQQADMVITSRGFYRRRMGPINEAEARSIPIYVLRSNTLPQMYQFLQAITTAEVREDAVEAALQEVELAAAKLNEGEQQVELNPRASFIRRLQHQRAEQLGLATQSQGRDPQRRVTIFRQG